MSDTVLTQLQALHAEYAARCEALRQDLAMLHSSDSAEQAQERENDEVMNELFAEAERLLHQVDKAIERRLAGQYGLCTRCGGAIAAARLEAVPAAELCFGCADQDQALS